MPSRERSHDRAMLRAMNAIRAIGGELRSARVSAGRSQQQVATAAHISQSQLARIELGQNRTVSVEALTVVGAAVGLDLVISTFPGRRIIRDEPQMRLLAALRERLGPEWTWSYEVPVAFGDQRAWDARARHRGTGVEFVVEAETRLHDVQALLRRLAGKRQVMPVRIILLVAATANNRSVLEFAGGTISTALPTDMRACLRALNDGRLPPADGIIVLETGARAGVGSSRRSSGLVTRPAGE
jgi:transcriptional regulator with XRE-family HTH domain